MGKDPPCHTDGMPYLLGKLGGKAGPAAVSAEGIKLTGSATVKGRGPSWAHPVVTGGRLYLRHDESLWASTRSSANLEANVFKPFPYRDVAGACGRTDNCRCGNCWVRSHRRGYLQRTTAR